jgi:hypothetical protein
MRKGNWCGSIYIREKVARRKVFSLITADSAERAQIFLLCLRDKTRVKKISNSPEDLGALVAGNLLPVVSDNIFHQLLHSSLIHLVDRLD